ncbi:transposase, partial [Alkalithermobacter paradoxus]|uniref:transposase n=1 Tax=Alkalithermobacter paradoxus TaxID=29349 RepID=UPI00117EF8A5
MLRKQDMINRDQLVLFTLDELVPSDHLLRKIDKVMNFDFIYELVNDMYSQDKGRPSIDPVVLIKLVFIQYLFGIGSMRKTIREVNLNIAYRWFLGYGIKDEIPHFSTFSKNYARRFKNSNVFEDIFAKILNEAVEAGFVDPKEVFIDATHVKASANKKKTYKEEVAKEAKIYR